MGMAAPNRLNFKGNLYISPIVEPSHSALRATLLADLHAAGIVEAEAARREISEILEYLIKRDHLSVGEGSCVAQVSPGGPEERVSISYHHFRAAAAAAQCRIVD